MLGLRRLLSGQGSVSVNEGLVSREHLLPVLVGSDDGGLSVEEIDLLEGETLGLGDEEVGEDDAEEAGGSPEEEDLDSEVGSLRGGEKKEGGRSASELGSLFVKRKTHLSSVDSSRGGVDEVRGSVTDSEVPEPVAGREEGERTSSATRQTTRKNRKHEDSNDASKRRGEEKEPELTRQ